ncbi:polysaccharide deacetylase family protein [bacterium LRH843]|nr:polysaccharide deacetylase family protein [bacterium LRH843]
MILAIGLLLIVVLAGCSVSSKTQEVTVLMYHHFDEDPAQQSSVTMQPERFKDQLLTLKEAGYTSIPERDLYDYYYHDKELPEKPLVITIDDGYLSNYELAYPILKELEMYATIYVVTSNRGKTPGSSPHFTWDQAREMVASGWIDIQTHTEDGHYYVEGEKKEGPFFTTKIWDGQTEESDEEYMNRIRTDLKNAKEQIEAEIGNKVYSFTYPYGAYNEQVIEAAKDLGYELMYTVKEGLNDKETNPYTLNRINADGSYTGEKLLNVVKKY